VSEKAILAIMAGALVLVLLVGGAGVYFVKFSLIRSRGLQIAKVDRDIETAETKSFLLVPNLPKKKLQDLRGQIQNENWAGAKSEAELLATIRSRIEKRCSTCESHQQKLQSAIKAKHQPSALELATEFAEHYEVHEDRSLPTQIQRRKSVGEKLEGLIPPFKGSESPGEPEVDLEYDAFIVLIERLRRQAGIAITQAKWVAPKRATGPGAKQTRLPVGLHKSDFEIQCLGGFYQLLRFLNLLETVNRQINVETFQVTAGKSTGVALHSMKVTLYTFSDQGTGPAQPTKKDDKTPTPTTPVSRDMPD